MTILEAALMLAFALLVFFWAWAIHQYEHDRDYRCLRPNEQWADCPDDCEHAKNGWPHSHKKYAQ